MSSFLTACGAILICVAISDVFLTLFHPGKRGALSDRTARGIWRGFRIAAARSPKLLTYAGPFAILTTIVSWVALNCVGFALIYLPRLGPGFAYDSGVAAAQQGGFTEALSLSLSALITLSEGAVPKISSLRLLCGFEAVLGFGLLSASVSWLLSIYPVLENERALAERATLLHHAELENELDVTSANAPEVPDWIMAMAGDLANLRNQLSQFPIAYYFHIGEKKSALSGAMAYLAEIGKRAADSEAPAMRVAGTALGGAVHNFLELLAEDFLRMPSHDKNAILLAYAREQMTDLMYLRRTVPYSRRAA